MQQDWDYVPMYTNTDTSPLVTNASNSSLTTPQEISSEQARQATSLVPPQDERDGPYTSQNIFYLRVRAWRLFAKAQENLTKIVVSSPFLSVSIYHTYQTAAKNSTLVPGPTTDLLARYNMSSVKLINPNLPRKSQVGVKNILDPDLIKTWSELSFCNNLGLVSTICNDKNITDLLNDYRSLLNGAGPSTAQTTKDCLDPVALVEKTCANAIGDTAISCADSGQKATMIQNAQQYCQELQDSQI